MGKPANRESTGRFKKGMSGNPSGRPKTPEEFKILVREKSTNAISTIISIMEDTTADTKDRLKASEIILSYAYGKPTQSFEIDSCIETKNKDLEDEEIAKGLLEKLRRIP